MLPLKAFLCERGEPVREMMALLSEWFYDSVVFFFF